MNYFWFGDSLKDAVSKPRLHSQLFPNMVLVEPNFPGETIKGLRRYGHTDITNDTSLFIGKSGKQLGKQFVHTFYLEVAIAIRNTVISPTRATSNEKTRFICEKFKKRKKVIESDQTALLANEERHIDWRNKIQTSSCRETFNFFLLHVKTSKKASTTTRSPVCGTVFFLPENPFLPGVNF